MEVCLWLSLGLKGHKGENFFCSFLSSALFLFCGESEEYLKTLVGHLVEVCRRRVLKINADNDKVMVQIGEEGLECEILVDGMRLEHVSKFKYLGCALDESGTDEVECCKKVVSGRRVAGAVRSLVNARSLQLEYAMVLHESY